MPITIGSNIASLRSQRQLFRANEELSSVFTRLSSGQRINRASDDAAGLAIADSLNADSRVFAQGIRNLNDGLSILNVADGALQELTNITFRLTELAEQAANGTLGTQQRRALDEEAQALSDEYFRIVQSTEFNDRQLFTADYGELRLQAGYGLDASIGQGLGGAIGDGTFGSTSAFDVGSGPRSIAKSDFNGDGSLDLVSANQNDNTVSILLGNGDGSFGSATAIDIGSAPSSVATGDLNGDGFFDLVSTSGYAVSILLSNGDGSFQEEREIGLDYEVSSILIEDLDNDGLSDFVVGSISDGIILTLIGNGDGTFEDAVEVGGSSSGSAIRAQDFDGDGFLDLVERTGLGDNVNVMYGNGDGTFGSTNLIDSGIIPTTVFSGDFNGDGVFDLLVSSSFDASLSVLFGDGNGAFEPGQVFSVNSSLPHAFGVEDYNGDGNLDVGVGDSTDDTISIFLGDGTGTFRQGGEVQLGTDPDAVTVGDFNNDGVLDLVTADQSGDSAFILLANTTDGVSPLLEFSLTSIADAKQALSQFSQKLDQLTEQRGQIGAFQARVEVAENVLQVTTENYQAAESRIRDADIAQEAADLVRLQILQQSGAAVLGQANLQPQLVLQLLGGGR